MADTSILKALQMVAAAGGQFLFSIETPAGATERLATPTQAAAIAAGELRASALLGLTAEEYSAWIEWGGLVQCSANTTAGNRCRNVVTGPISAAPEVWKKKYAAQPYCHVHGGE